MYRVAFVVLIIMLLSGCDYIRKDPEVQSIALADPECEALKRASFKLVEIPPLDLSKFKSIEFINVEDENGKKWLTFEFDDYKNFAEFLLIIEKYIDIQHQSIKEIQEFYLKALEEDEDF